MNTKAINSAAGVINAALTQNRTATGIALALDSAGMLMTPETAAEIVQLDAERGRYRTAWRMAYQRAQGRGWAADRAGARARDLQRALQDMLFTVIVAQMACRAARLEAEQLRALVANARALHVKFPDSEHCQHDAERWPCPTMTALSESGGEAR